MTLLPNLTAMLIAAAQRLSAGDPVVIVCPNAEAMTTARRHAAVLGLNMHRALWTVRGGRDGQLRGRLPADVFVHPDNDPNDEHVAVLRVLGPLGWEAR